MNAVEINWKAWATSVNTVPSRYAELPQPYVKDGWKYATDCRAIVRVPTDEEDTNNVKLPNANFFANGETLPWPEPDVEEQHADCPECEGYGTVGSVDCEECDGVGMTDCEHCGSEIDCHACWGEGVVGGQQCGTCNGERSFRQPKLQRMQPGFFIDVGYDALVRELPNPRFFIDEDKCQIKFDGGEAVVMRLLD